MQLCNCSAWQTRVRTFAAFILAGGLLCGATTARAQTTYYVDENATGPTHDGSSWCDAYLYLQDALAVAVATDDIRVANGTYKPDRDTANPTGTGSRTAAFQLVDGVVMQGGFAG